jgi:hypothetical protein
LIKNDLDYERAKSEFHFKRVQYLYPGLRQSEANNMKSPRVFKTHEKVKDLPAELTKKAKVMKISYELTFTVLLEI